MKKRYVFLLVILTCAAIYYWWNQTSVVQLNVPEQMTLYSIDGDDDRRDEQGLPEEQKPNVEYFHNFPVLGKMEITDEKKRQALIESINRDFNKGGIGARCFIPRHALRLVEHGKTNDVLICYECGWAKIDPKPGRKLIVIRENSKPLFDQTLTDAGIKLAPGKKDQSTNDQDKP